MNRCTLGYFKKQVLRSATGADIILGAMNSDDDSKPVATLPAAKPGMSQENVFKRSGESPQEVIQHYKPANTVGSVVRLPDKIMAILMSEEAPDAIWWLQKGTAFAMQKEKFQEMILDKHFRGNKFKSLVRNLHRWGFKRMTCDTSPAGKTIAFSHKYFRQDKPELVQLIQITKEKDVASDFIRGRRQAVQATVLPSTAPPTALRVPAPAAGPLREEGPRLGHLQDTPVGLLGSVPPGARQQPSLAAMVAAEHHQNLSARGPDSLLHSLTTEWQRTNQDMPLQSQLQATMGGRQLGVAGRPQLDLGGGVPGTYDRSGRDNLARIGIRASTEQDQLEQMRPSVLEAQRMQRLGSLLQAEGESLENALQSAALQQQRRDTLLQQHLAAASLVPAAADSRLRLQQQLAGRAPAATCATAATTTNPSLFHHSTAPSLLPQPQVNPSYISQLTSTSAGGNVAGAPMGALQQDRWSLEQLLAMRNQVGSQLQRQTSVGARSMDPPPVTQQDASTNGGLTSDELRYLAEMRRRGS